MSYYHLANYDAALPFLEKFSEVNPSTALFMVILEFVMKIQEI